MTEEVKKEIKKEVHLAFNYNRETLRFLIRNKEIFYSDRIFKELIRIMPKPENFMRTIIFSRGRIPNRIIELFNYTPQELQEYESAKDDEALAEIVIRDAKSRGCILVKKEVVEK